MVGFGGFSRVLVYTKKRVYYRVTITFTRNPLLAEAPCPYYVWCMRLNSEKWLYLSCNYERKVRIRQYYAAIDIL